MLAHEINEENVFVALITNVTAVRCPTCSVTNDVEADADLGSTQCVECHVFLDGVNNQYDGEE